MSITEYCAVPIYTKVLYKYRRNLTMDSLIEVKNTCAQEKKILEKPFELIHENILDRYCSIYFGSSCFDVGIYIYDCKSSKTTIPIEISYIRLEYI